MYTHNYLEKSIEFRYEPTESGDLFCSTYKLSGEYLGAYGFITNGKRNAVVKSPLRVDLGTYGSDETAKFQLERELLRQLAVCANVGALLRTEWLEGYGERGAVVGNAK